ncbi:MAG: carboxypeptidase regulatory-like domain-containing protein [Polyangiaceae bacterium]|nr:carboxypeptidase regulatory-like domain-containing protein [Polyangiaceae bacterium]
MNAIDPRERRRAWISAALVSAALLIVPFALFALLPSRPKIAIPVMTAAAVEYTPPPVPKPKPTPKPTAVQPPEPEPLNDSAAVRGRVVSPNGSPVSRAWVACTDRDFGVATSNDGTFELVPEAAGCTAVARRSGFGASDRIKLVSGDSKANTLELRDGGRIEGTVVDETGSPVARFQIAVEKFIGEEGDDEGGNGRSRTIEDDQGRFVMTNVTPGKYVIAATAEGRPSGRSRMFDVESGRTVSGVRIELPKGVSVRGIVTDANTRAAVAGATVALDGMGVSRALPSTTDQNGAYTLEGVPSSGPFSIRVEREGYRSRIVSGLSARGGDITSDVALVPKGEGDKGDTELGGIGAVLAPAPNAPGVLVASLTADGPAAKGGLQRGDRIVRIDGASTETLTLSEHVQRLRGEPGTRVSLTVVRDGREIGVDLVRAVVVR